MEALEQCCSILGNYTEQEVCLKLLLSMQYAGKQGKNGDELFEEAENFFVYNFCGPFPITDKEDFFKVYSVIADLLPDISPCQMLCRQLQVEKNQCYMVSELVIYIYKNHFNSDYYNNATNVLITDAEYWAYGLEDIIDNSKNYTLTSNNISASIFLKEAFSGRENVHVLIADSYSREFTNENFDLVLSFPIFGARCPERSSGFKSSLLDEIALENLPTVLNDNGALLITMPLGIGFKEGMSKKLREHIQKNYYVQEISELPGGIHEGTNIKTYFIVIKNAKKPRGNSTKLYFYESIPTRRKTANTVNDIKIEAEQAVNLKEFKNWNLAAMRTDDELKDFINSDYPKKKLSDVADVFSGKAVLKKDDDGNISVLSISNLLERSIDYTNVDHTELTMRKASPYILQDGDILLTARSTTLRTAIFKEQDDTYIANVSLIVIRPNKKLMNSIYLKLFFDSAVGNKLIKSVQKGSVLIAVNYKDLGLIEVPVPPLSEQDEKAKEYLKELEIYESKIIPAQERWNEALARLTQF